MKVTRIKTGSLYEAKYNYSRAVAVGDWIFVSNTAGRDFSTREMSRDAVEQTRQAFRNIEGALAAAGSSLSDIVRARIAIPYAEDVARVMACVGETFQGVDPCCTVTCPPLAGPEYRVEIEVTACKGAGGPGADFVKAAL